MRMRERVNYYEFRTNAVRFDGIRFIHWLQAVLEQSPEHGRQYVGIEKDAGGRIRDQVEIVVPMVAVVRLLQIAGKIAANRNREDLKTCRM